MSSLFQPDAASSVVVTDTQTLIGNNTTTVVPIFRITGSVQIKGLYGVVTTVLGANNTAAYWRLNDQTAQTNVTLNTGTTLSAAVVGSTILKITSSASALTLSNSSAGRFQETAANHMALQEFTITAKNTANTDIEFVYTTTDTPTSGVIQFFLRYTPLSSNGSVAAL